MASSAAVRVSESPLGQLRKARAAKRAVTRAKYARAGLEQSPEDAETRWLLMRQLYISHLELGALERAREVAFEMLGVFVEVEDVARFDLARVLMARHEWEQARVQLTHGREVAPVSRQWDHLFALARLEAVLGNPALALQIVDGAEQSVARLAQQPVVHGARMVWRVQSGQRSRKDALARAYERLSLTQPLPVLGDYFAANLLVLLGRPEADRVFEGFVRAAERLSAIGRFSLAAELHSARQWLGQPSLLT